MVEKLIEHFKLIPHPEGGWYSETYKSNEKIDRSALPERFTGSRVFSTAIYFLLEENNFSAFHRIRSDECWHFYEGDPLQLFIIHPSGELETITLGKDIEKENRFQHVVPAGSWFASRPAPGSQFCFTGCTVAPGFEFEEFELADASILVKQYPQLKELIFSLCR